jgi:hypothetical protein
MQPAEMIKTRRLQRELCITDERRKRVLSRGEAIFQGSLQMIPMEKALFITQKT